MRPLVVVTFFLFSLGTLGRLQERQSTTPTSPTVPPNPGSSTTGTTTDTSTTSTDTNTITTPTNTTSTTDTTTSTTTSSTSTTTSSSSTTSTTSAPQTSNTDSQTSQSLTQNTFTTTELVSGTSSSTTSSTSAAATAQNDSNNSPSEPVKTSTIIGLSVAGGIAVLGAVAFIIWKVTRKRFSDFDASGEEIKWPELNNETHALPTRTTGRAGIDDDGYDEAGIGAPPRDPSFYGAASTSAAGSMADLNPSHNDPYAVPPLPHMNPNQPYRDDPSGNGAYYDPYRGPVPQSLHDPAEGHENIPMSTYSSSTGEGYQYDHAAGYDGRTSPGPSLALGGRQSPGPQVAYGGRRSPGPGPAYGEGFRG